MYKLIKSFISLFLLKTKPEDIIYSKLLLVFLIVTDFIVNYGSSVIGIKIFNVVNKKNITFSIPTATQSLLVLFILFLVLWALVYGVLALYNKTNRFVQVLTSLVAVDILLRLLIIACMALLQYAPFLGTILLIPLMYWEFVLYIFIFANSFNFNYFRAGIFSLVYMLLQNSLGELLVNYICNYN